MSKRLSTRKRLLASLISMAIAGTVAAPPIAWAQSADATLRGKAAANSDVTAKNIATGAMRRTKAGDDGSYTLVGLPPGTYQVDAGGAAQTVTLTVASTATLDLVAGATPAGAASTATLEGVTVTATTLAEVKTPEVGATISQRQIQTIPQITRNFLEFADTVPGMAFTVDPSGHTKLTGGAQNANGVNVYIDGVGQKNYVKEGGVAGQFATQGNPFPQLAIGEYKVITSNYKAEYDQISSAAVTADTKSGTNEFHGELYDQYTDDGWRADTPSEKAARDKVPSQEKEYGFAIGGPIIQDQMHFFFAYEAKRFDTPKAVVPGVIGVTQFLPPDVAAQIGPSGLPFDEDLYFAKIDWEFSDRDRIELSSKVRKEDQIDNLGTGVAASAAIDVINDDTRIDGRWQHSADKWFNDFLLTYERTFNKPSSFSIGNGSTYTTSIGGLNDANILIVGPADPLSTQNKGQRGPGFQDDLTFNSFSWNGDHVVKLGVKYKDVKLTAQDAENINPNFFYDVTLDGTATQPYKAFFTNPVAGLNPVAESHSKQFGTYIQDDWAVNEKLTLNLGVRWDYERTPTFLNYVTPANVVAALNGPNPDPNAPAGQTYAQALALGGVDVNDYISTGHNRKAPKNEFQPRLGFSYDFFGDEAHVLHGGAGRAYDRDLFDYLQLEQTKTALPELNVYFRDPITGLCHNNGTPCFDFNPSYLSSLGNLQSLVASTNLGQEVDLINNNLKAPYSDQYSLGIRNKVGDWNTDVTVARIISKDGLAFTLGNRFPNGAFFDGGKPWGDGVPGFGNFIIGSNGIETRNTQVLLSADKPYTKDSGWGATLAYTYQNAKQNRDINEHYAFDEATIHDYPFIRSNQVPRHRFVATGSLDGAWGLIYSAKLTLETPIPKNDFTCHADGGVFPNGNDCVPAALIPRGQSFITGGKVFGNRQIDAQVTKNFDLTHGMSMYVRADFLNIFNYKNYSDYVLTGNGTFSNTMAAYLTDGNINGVPRTFKLSAGFRW